MTDLQRVNTEWTKGQEQMVNLKTEHKALLQCHKNNLETERAQLELRDTHLVTELQRVNTQLATNV